MKWHGFGRPCTDNNLFGYYWINCTILIGGYIFMAGPDQHSLMSVRNFYRCEWGIGESNKAQVFQWYGLNFNFDIGKHLGFVEYFVSLSQRWQQGFVDLRLQPSEPRTQVWACVNGSIVEWSYESSQRLSLTFSDRLLWFHLSFLGYLNWSYVFDILFLANPNGLILLLCDLSPVNVNSRCFLLPKGNFFSSKASFLWKTSEPQHRPSSTWTPRIPSAFWSLPRRKKEHGSNGDEVNPNSSKPCFTLETTKMVHQLVHKPPLKDEQFRQAWVSSFVSFPLEAPFLKVVDCVQTPSRKLCECQSYECPISNLQHTGVWELLKVWTSSGYFSGFGLWGDPQNPTQRDVLWPFSAKPGTFGYCRWCFLPQASMWVSIGNAGSDLLALDCVKLWLLFQWITSFLPL